MSIEKNTVILDVNVYNDLRDIKKNVENDKIVSYIHSNNPFGSYSSETHYHTKDVVIKSLVNRSNKLIETIRELRIKISESQNNKEEINVDYHKEKINEIKKYNLFRLIKWWWKNKKNLD